MPELPEVETVRSQLAPALIGRTLRQVDCGPPSYFFLTPPRELKKRLTGAKIEGLDRLGKTLLLQLEGGARLLLHLGMTGQIVNRALPPDPHVHLVLHLSDQSIVSFRDVRKFGKVEWIAAGMSSRRLDKLGPDALAVSSDYLRQVLRSRKVPIKTALLNQQLLAGVGNIYADEALHAARIRPTRRASRLTRKDVDRLTTELLDLLRRAVKSGGSTINDYLHPDGNLGGFQNWHCVYGKAGQACPRCGGEIARVTIAARSSHFCRGCQR